MKHFSSAINTVTKNQFGFSGRCKQSPPLVGRQDRHWSSDWSATEETCRAHCSASAHVPAPSPSTYNTHTHTCFWFPHTCCCRSVCSSSQGKAGSTHEEKWRLLFQSLICFQEFISHYFKDADDWMLQKVCGWQNGKSFLSLMFETRCDSHVGGSGGRRHRNRLFVLLCSWLSPVAQSIFINPTWYVRTKELRHLKSEHTELVFVQKRHYSQ